MTCQRVVFYLNPKKDTDLIGWLKKHDDGDRSAAIRTTLRSGLVQPEDDGINLTAIQKVVETAVKNSMERDTPDNTINC